MLQIKLGTTLVAKTYDELLQEGFRADNNGDFPKIPYIYTQRMVETYGGTVVTVSYIGDTFFRIKEDSGFYKWTRSMVKSRSAKNNNLRVFTNA